MANDVCHTFQKSACSLCPRDSRNFKVTAIRRRMAVSAHAGATYKVELIPPHGLPRPWRDLNEADVSSRRVASKHDKTRRNARTRRKRSCRQRYDAIDTELFEQTLADVTVRTGAEQRRLRQRDNRAPARPQIRHHVLEKQILDVTVWHGKLTSPSVEALPPQGGDARMQSKPSTARLRGRGRSKASPSSRPWLVDARHQNATETDDVGA